MINTQEFSEEKPISTYKSQYICWYKIIRDLFQFSSLFKAPKSTNKRTNVRKIYFTLLKLKFSQLLSLDCKMFKGYVSQDNYNRQYNTESYKDKGGMQVGWELLMRNICTKWGWREGERRGGEGKRKRGECSYESQSSCLLYTNCYSFVVFVVVMMDEHYE